MAKRDQFEYRNILILGIGGVGMYIAKRLINDGYYVTVIESKKSLVAHANENLDARVIEGNAMESSCWREAQADKVDLLIAVTDNDAINMIACYIADKFGIKKKVARVRSLDFGQENSVVKGEELKIDLMIHPEELVAQEIVMLIKREAANDVVDLCDGQIKVLAARIDDNSPLVRQRLQDLAGVIDIPFRMVSIARGITTIIPHGDQQILPNDHVFIMALAGDMPKLMEKMGIRQHKVQYMMIVGGGLMGKRVAQLLEKTVHVKLIEKDPALASELASDLKNTQVLNGDGTDANVLALAGVLDMETFVATTEDNETNIISCLLAKHLMNKQNRRHEGVQAKTIALVNKEDYLVLASTIGLDIAFNTKISAANEILKFIRRSELLSVAHLHGVDTEVVELVASAGSTITKKPLKKFHQQFVENDILIGGVTQNNKWKIAIGDTHIQEGDRVVVICTSLSLKKIQSFFH